ncbi:MAG TPA: hypothetical protein VLF69_05560 [Candidatus Saccharimonadales bacterium]|nr:hypothetical protein [Candidatus Saccharimonadales bacterium]
MSNGLTKPPLEAAQETLTSYRHAVRDVALASDASVSNRIRDLFALQEGSDLGIQTAMDCLYRAEWNPVAIKTLGGVAVGLLNPQHAWDIAVLEQPPGQNRSAGSQLGLIAKFRHLRLLSPYVDITGHSYGGGGIRTEVGPGIKKPDQTAVPVNLPGNFGDEFFVTRLRNIPTAVTLGWPDIRDHIGDGESDDHRKALQDALVVAIDEISFERGAASASISQQS